MLQTGARGSFWLLCNSSPGGDALTMREKGSEGKPLLEKVTCPGKVWEVWFLSF